MHKLYIDGKWVESANGESIPVIDPSTGEAFDQIAHGTKVDIDRAVAAARRALDGPWGRLTATERGRILMRMADLIGSRVDELAAIEARDTGKPMGQARADITVAARYYEFYGSGADKLHGQVAELSLIDDFERVALSQGCEQLSHIVELARRDG